MTPEQFIIWLKGYVELSDPYVVPSLDSWQKIKDKISIVNLIK